MNYYLARTASFKRSVNLRLVFNILGKKMELSCQGLICQKLVLIFGPSSIVSLNVMLSIIPRGYLYRVSFLFEVTFSQMTLFCVKLKNQFNQDSILNLLNQGLSLLKQNRTLSQQRLTVLSHIPRLGHSLSVSRQFSLTGLRPYPTQLKDL